MSFSHNKPDHVKVPVTTTELGWILGWAQPDVEGFTPGAGFHEGLDHEAALVACIAEAAQRGISPEAYDAAVISSMMGNKYDKVLRLLLKKKGVTL